MTQINTMTDVRVAPGSNDGTTRRDQYCAKLRAGIAAARDDNDTRMLGMLAVSATGAYNATADHRFADLCTYAMACQRVTSKAATQ